MTSNQPTPLNRRELLRNGGLAISLGALLAAVQIVTNEHCGQSGGFF